jgi:hypothetical protein
MQKTTLYLPKELKAALSREALREAVARSTPPQPQLPLFRSRKPRLAERIEAALAGSSASPA